MDTFRHLRMPFGMKGSPPTFQRALDIILSGVRWQICLVYLDDDIVFLRTDEEHAWHLDTLLSLLRSAGISIKLKKCSFFPLMVHYLKHVVSSGKLSVAEAAADAFKTFTFPRTLTQVRSFLRACNVYPCFVMGVEKIAHPLPNMTGKDADPNLDDSTKSQRQAFEAMKERMISPSIFALPRHGRPYMIDTAVSPYKLDCTLLQEYDQPNDWRPVGYWSYSLNDSGRNYSATEREFFAVVWAVRTIPYVEGTKLTVRTDQEAWMCLVSLTETSGRLDEWRLHPLEYDFTNQYRPWRVYQVPDALSGLVSPRVAYDPRQAVEVDDEIPTVSARITVRDVSNDPRDYVRTSSCDQEVEHVFSTAWNQAGAGGSPRVRTRDKPRGSDEAAAIYEPIPFWEEKDEFDAAEIERAELRRKTNFQRLLRLRRSP